MRKVYSTLLAVLVTTVFVANPALAAKPEGVGNGKGKGNKPKVEKSQKAYKAEGAGNTLNFFGDGRRDIIRDYYSGQFNKGNCPPGLAKKNNGCMPPGQAKKWRVGHPLPGDVIYHDLPDDLLRRLGRTPEGYKLVRVGVDILKIGIGSGMVIEAVEDLGDLF